MQPERNERLADLIASALECSPAERAQFLSDVCGSDVALREEAESLLRFQENTRDFIEVPAYELAAEAILEKAREPRDENVRGHLEDLPVLPPKDTVGYRALKFAQRNWLALLAALVGLAVITGLVFALREAENARRQRDIAQGERSRAERINSFLQRMLSFSNQSVTSVWPVAGKKNVTVSEMLDQIGPQVQTELADQPDVRGEVLRTIGSAYAAQGQYDAAEKNLRSAVETQTALQGEENGRVADMMVELGVLLYRREKFAEADRLLQKSVVYFRKQEQTHAADFSAIKLANALDYLGLVKFYERDIKAARTLLDEALWIASAAQPKGRDRSVLNAIRTDLGGLLVLLGDFKKGETLLRESLAESRKATKTPQWEMGTTLQALGELGLAKNQPAEAEKNLLEAEQIYRETLGEKNLYFARNLERRAAVLLLRKDLKPAEELARKSFAITKACSPEDRLPWTDPMMTLSDILIKDGRIGEGEDYLRETIRICEEQRAKNYAAISLAKIRLSQLLLSQNRLTEAENLAFEAHSEARQHLEPQNPLRKATANNLVQIYEKQGKHDVAQTVK